MILLKNIKVKGEASDILIKDGIISSIRPSAGSAPDAAGAEVVDCTGKTAVPGFVNMHTHAGMSLMRGIGEDISFHEWLKRIWEVESRIDAEFVYHATKVACLEMIKTGTTTFNDHYWYMPMAYKAAQEMGLRSVLAYVICDRNDQQESERQKVQCARMYEIAAGWNASASFAIAIHQRSALHPQ